MLLTKILMSLLESDDFLFLLIVLSLQMLETRLELAMLLSRHASALLSCVFALLSGVKTGLKLGYLITLFLQHCLPLRLLLSDTCRNLLLDHRASVRKRLIEVLFLLLDLALERKILLLDTLDEDMTELAHILQLALHALQLGHQVGLFLLEARHFVLFLRHFRG